MHDSNKKILKVLLVLSIIPSAYLGIKAMFIDLYNPGSLEARELNDLVNRLFIVSFIFAAPLLFDKYHSILKWKQEYETLSEDEQRTSIIKAIKPVIVQVLFIIALAVGASIIITMYFNIPPEVIKNYQDYYSIHSFNYNEINNLSNNVSLNLTNIKR